jgi:hypothetical protein
MEEMKTLAEIYLPAEQNLIGQLFHTIQSLIREKKKIPYLDADNNPKDEFLEYFTVTEELITFNKKGGNKSKDKVTVKELKEALKLVFRTDEEFTAVGFNKMFGSNKFVTTPMYLFVNMVLEEIKSRKIVGSEISHKSFGSGVISKLEHQKEFVWFKYDEEPKMLSMDYFLLNKEDQMKIKNRLAGAQPELA